MKYEDIPGKRWQLKSLLEDLEGAIESLGYAKQYAKDLPQVNTSIDELTESVRKLWQQVFQIDKELLDQYNKFFEELML